MAAAMTWAIMPGMSSLLRGWLYGSHQPSQIMKDGTQAAEVGEEARVRSG
jgi:hypothetical protein